jgi:hypothetical protein
MLFLLLTGLSLCSLPLLSDKTLARVIRSRQPYEVLVALFEDSQAADRTFQTAFRNASSSLEGLLKMVILDVRQYSQLPTEYGVREVPSVRIWTDSGLAHYRGRNTTQAIVKTLGSFIPDLTERVDDTWTTNLETSPVAIFFTETGRVPPVWKTMSIRFKNTSLRIGVSDSPDVIQAYKVPSVPAIFASNGQSSGFFKGKLNATVLIEWLDGFRSDKGAGGRSDTVKKSSVSVGEYETPDKFESACVGGKNLCIVVKAAKVSSAAAQIAKDFSKLKIRWFVGVDGLPYPFMKTGSGSWVYNPRRDGFAHAASDEELRNILEAVENGQGKFTKRAELDEL